MAALIEVQRADCAAGLPRAGRRTTAALAASVDQGPVEHQLLIVAAGPFQVGHGDAAVEVRSRSPRSPPGRRWPRHSPRAAGAPPRRRRCPRRRPPAPARDRPAAPAVRTAGAGSAASAIQRGDRRATSKTLRDICRSGPTSWRSSPGRRRQLGRGIAVCTQALHPRGPATTATGCRRADREACAHRALSAGPASPSAPTPRRVCSPMVRRFA